MSEGIDGTMLFRKPNTFHIYTTKDLREYILPDEYDLYKKEVMEFMERGEYNFPFVAFTEDSYFECDSTPPGLYLYGRLLCDDKDAVYDEEEEYNKIMYIENILHYKKPEREYIVNKGKNIKHK